MSKPAAELAITSKPVPGRDDDGSGPFRIADRLNGTMLPPAEAGRDDVISLEALGGMLEAEPEPAGPVAVPPIPSALRSGVFERELIEAAPGSEVAVQEPADLVGSMRPYYREGEGRSERAELQIEDFSLRLDNPWVASSLVPPARRAAPRSWAIALAAAMGGALVGITVWQLAQPAAQVQPPARVSAPVAIQPRTSAAPGAETPAPVPAVQPAAPQPKVLAAQPPAAAAPKVQRTKLQPAPVAAKVERAAAPVEQGANPTPAAELPAATKVAAAVDPARAALAAALSAAPAATAPIGSAPAAIAVATTDQPEQLAPAADETAAVALPETPTREQVMAGFDAIRGQLDACAAGQHGIVHIDATVANSGRVSYAVLEGAFQGSPEGSCMARAVRGARFPRFSQPSLKISYPVAL